MTDKAILNCFNTFLYSYFFQNKLCSHPTSNQIISQPGIHSCCSLCLRCLLPSLSSSTLQTLFNFQVSAKMALFGVIFGCLYLHQIELDASSFVLIEIKNICTMHCWVCMCIYICTYSIYIIHAQVYLYMYIHIYTQISIQCMCTYTFYINKS